MGSVMLQVPLPFGAVEDNREMFPTEVFLRAVSRWLLPQGQLLIPPSTCSWPQLAPNFCCGGATNFSCSGLGCCSLGTPDPALLTPFLPWLWFLVLPGTVLRERAGLAGQKGAAMAGCPEMMGGSFISYSFNSFETLWKRAPQCFFLR